MPETHVLLLPGQLLQQTQHLFICQVTGTLALVEGEDSGGERAFPTIPPPPAPSPIPAPKPPGPHRVGQRVHAPTVLRQQAAGILHTPVGRRVQGGPAIPIPELRVVASLKEQPGGQDG